MNSQVADPNLTVHKHIASHRNENISDAPADEQGREWYPLHTMPMVNIHEKNTWLPLKMHKWAKSESSLPGLRFT